MQVRNIIISAICSASLFGGCTVAKVTGKAAALPFKAAYKTGEYTTKGVYLTGQGAGTVTYHTGMFTGKGVYYAGKGTYNVARVPIRVTNAALDTSIKVLTVTTQVVDLSGKAVTLSRTLPRSEVDGYIVQAKNAANVLDIFVDIYRG